MTSHVVVVECVYYNCRQSDVASLAAGVGVGVADDVDVDAVGVVALRRHLKHLCVVVFADVAHGHFPQVAWWQVEVEGFLIF